MTMLHENEAFYKRTNRRRLQIEAVKYSLDSVKVHGLAEVSEILLTTQLMFTGGVSGLVKIWKFKMSHLGYLQNMRVGGATL